MQMSTTMLSKCGGFVTRRNNQMLAKTEQSSLQPSRPEPQSERLQGPNATTTTTTTTTAAATATAFVCPRLCAQQSYSLLSCGSYFGVLLLLILCASYSSALPRRALGRHLILPHRHHVHLRSAGQEHKPDEHSLRYKKKLNCTMNMANYNAINLRYARDVVIGTRASTIDLMTACFKETEEELAQRYRLHSLHLEYPLKKAVNNSQYNGQSEENKSLEEDVLDIYHSLVKIRRVLANETKAIDAKWRNNYFVFIEEKVEHNIANVEALLSCTAEGEGHIPDPFHNHPCRMYGIVNEFVKLLHVLEIKYSLMLRQQEAVEAEEAAEAAE
ncbi:PREDICTED: uncharacterized protein LOC108618495 [Drosophila arizonae]|uniref:Uncharacterized protein LOC108618495 n=1 Tax=Drosophila arizonae TaxID=7263 RepID=A0ABM1PS30_DROAR|nr:PREDICTED: uncharacterized protein LOC108618495 [Drosophila arizonae]